MKIKLVMFPVFLFLFIISCKTEDELGRKDFFLKYYGWGLTNIGNDIKQTQDNGFVVLSTIFLKEDSTQMCLFKTDEYGNLIWDKHWTKNSKTAGASVVEDKNGNIYIYGSYQKTITNSDLILCCYNRNGDLVWNKTYGSSSNEIATNLIISEDNNLYLLANSDTKNLGNQNPKGTFDLMLTKISLNSDSIWTKYYGGNENDFANSIIEKYEHDGFIITGSTNSFSEQGQANSNILLISTNINGVQISKKTFGGLDLDQGAQVEMPNAEDIILTGSITDRSISRLVLIKTKKDIQNVVSIKLFGDSKMDLGQSLLIDKAGNTAIVGTTSEFGDGTTNLLLVKVNSSNEQVLNKKFGGVGSEVGRKIIQPRNDGGYLMLFNSTVDKSTVISLLRTNVNGLLDAE